MMEASPTNPFPSPTARLALYAPALLMLMLSLPAYSAEPARPADAFVDSMGTNVHTSFGGPYLDGQGLIDAVNYLGFRYVRDIPTSPNRLNALLAGTGAKVCVISQYYWFDS